MRASNGGRLSKPWSSHRKRGTTDDDEIIELVGDIRCIPVQRAEKNISNLVQS